MTKLKYYSVTKHVKISEASEMDRKHQPIDLSQFQEPAYNDRWIRPPSLNFPEWLRSVTHSNWILWKITTSASPFFRNESNELLQKPVEVMNCLNSQMDLYSKKCSVPDQIRALMDCCHAR